MSEESNKALMAEESDPQSIAERQLDAPGSFLDLYRSNSVVEVSQNQFFVDQIVRDGVIPEQLRYGSMARGNMHVYRGVVKGHDGNMFYFNYHDGAPFHLVPADTPTKEWEANKLFKSCRHGCDLIRKATSAPIDPGEAVDENRKSVV